MPAQETTAFTFSSKIEPERALRLGAATAVAPLWAAYYATAGAGVAYWWMTAWTRRSEEKSFAPKALAKPVKIIAEIVEAPVEAAAEIVEAAPAALEAAAEKPAAAKAAPAKPAAAKTAAPKTVSAKSAAAAKTVRPKS